MNELVSEELGKLVVRLEGEVDLDRSPAVRKVLLECVARKMDVVVDLSEVQYIDSSGIATLVEGLQWSHSNNTKFRLTNLTPMVKDVFEIARLLTVFEVYDSQEEALKGV